MITCFKCLDFPSYKYSVGNRKPWGIDSLFIFFIKRDHMCNSTSRNFLYLISLQKSSSLRAILSRWSWTSVGILVNYAIDSFRTFDFSGGLDFGLMEVNVLMAAFKLCETQLRSLKLECVTKLELRTVEWMGQVVLVRLAGLKGEDMNLWFGWFWLNPALIELECARSQKEWLLL